MPSPIHVLSLTVRLLVSRSRTWTSKLLGLAPSVVGNEERTVVLDERLLELVFRVLVDEFLVVCDLYKSTQSVVVLLIIPLSRKLFPTRTIDFAMACRTA